MFYKIRVLSHVTFVAKQTNKPLLLRRKTLVLQERNYLVHKEEKTTHCRQN
jgi:hypothetical protein